MEDVEIITDKQKFKYKVNGVIIYNGKLLTIKREDNVSYCLPGGHVEIGEDSKSAVIREMLEETGILVSIDKELAIVENFYLDKNSLNTHEIGLYYIVKPDNLDKVPLSNYSRTENDKGEIKTHKFEWLDISILKEIDFRPEFIKKKLMDNNYTLEHIIIKQ